MKDMNNSVVFSVKYSVIDYVTLSVNSSFIYSVAWDSVNKSISDSVRRSVRNSICNSIEEDLYEKFVLHIIR